MMLMLRDISLSSDGPSSLRSPATPSDFGLVTLGDTVPRTRRFDSIYITCKRTPTMAEDLQQLILNILNDSGTIKDTRTIVIPGSSRQASSSDAQITILGALNSLDSREVPIRILIFATILC